MHSTARQWYPPYVGSPIGTAPDSIQNTLRDKGVRLTRQRRLLLDLLDNSGLHLDADTLFQMAKETDPKLNRVTVYRTLKLLKESGLVDELDLAHFQGEQHFYETRLKQEHAHIICLRCGRVEEFFGDPLKAVRAQVASQFGFEIVFARTEIGGYCSHCQVLRAQDAARNEASRDGSRNQEVRSATGDSRSSR
jgi:Fur family ferric uptake transcriptional regulator